MPRISSKIRAHKARFAVSTVVLPILVVGLLLLVPGVGSALATNSVQLDNGTCGQNLQMGSDRTASRSATPTFLLAGDGGAPSYQAWIDGVSIGTFYGVPNGTVCIAAPRLADGSHTLTLSELSPNPNNTIAPFAFKVDTTMPAVPSAPTLASFSDTGVSGDNVTSFTSPTVTGTADPGSSVSVYNGQLLVGGAATTSSGSWTVRANLTSAGTYSLTAKATDEAANTSAASTASQITIDQTPPTVSFSSPAAGATVSGTVNLAANASDNQAVWTVAFQVDGTTLATDTTSPYTYSWNSNSVANGTHTLTATATDTAGNTTSTSETITVQSSGGGGTTTPSAPTLTSATGGNGNISVAWTAPSSNGGAAITGYRIYRSTTSGTETLLTTLGNVTGWTDSSVTNGTTYYYKVTALNSVGESATSNELAATPSAPIIAPSAPSLTTATPGNGSVALAWNAPSNNGGAAITGYRIYRSTTSGNETLLTTLSSVTSWTNTGLTNGSTYYYKVSALNSAGESVASNELSATPATMPAAPTLMSAVPGNSVTLTWAAPTNTGGATVTGYRVYRGTASGGETFLTSVGNVTTYTDETTTYGTTYYYEVSAVTSVGESALSNEMSATPIVAAGAPGLNTAAAGNGTVGLAWSAPGSNGGSAITGYRVYRSTTSGNETLLTTLGNVTSWTDTGVTIGITYYYEVSALNSAGESVASNEMSATPYAVVPSAPLLTTAVPGNGSVALGWSPPGNTGGAAVTGYRVYRGTSSGHEALYVTLGNVTGWTDSSVSNGTTYYYEVSAVNSAGESFTSNEMSATPTAPVTAPSAPALSNATAGNGSVALGWSAPSSNGGSAVTGYRIYRGTTSGNETLLTTLGNVTSWTDTGVTIGTTYYYKVSALNSAGESVASNEMSATPFAVAPSAPTLGSTTAGTGSVALSWSAPSNNGGSAITGYRIYRSTSSGNETLLTTLGNVTSWTDTGVSNGTTYYYKVSALNSVGESTPSNERSATPTAAATTPGVPTLTGASPGRKGVALAWTAPASNGGSAITGYRVYRSTSSGSETLLATVGNVTSWTDSGASSGTTYYYKVTAVNAVGEGARSNELSTTSSKKGHH